jgi:hypothetical protein
MEESRSTFRGTVALFAPSPLLQASGPGFLLHLKEGAMFVREIMTPNAETVTPETPRDLSAEVLNAVSGYIH